MANRKLTKMDLDDIRYIARNYFIDGQKGDLTEEQFKTKCFTEAVCTVLQIQGVEFPWNRNCETIED